MPRHNHFAVFFFVKRKEKSREWVEMSYKGTAITAFMCFISVILEVDGRRREVEFAVAKN